MKEAKHTFGDWEQYNPGESSFSTGTRKGWPVVTAKKPACGGKVAWSQRRSPPPRPNAKIRCWPDTDNSFSKSLQHSFVNSPSPSRYQPTVSASINAGSSGLVECFVVSDATRWLSIFVAVGCYICRWVGSGIALTSTSWLTLTLVLNNIKIWPSAGWEMLSQILLGLRLGVRVGYPTSTCLTRLTAHRVSVSSIFFMTTMDAEALRLFLDNPHAKLIASA